jgi:hypothetical protein
VVVVLWGGEPASGVVSRYLISSARSVNDKTTARL